MTDRRKSTHCDPRPSLSSFSSLYGHFPPRRHSASCWTPSATGVRTGKTHSLHFLLNLCYTVKPRKSFPECFWRGAQTVIGEGGTPASALYPSSPKTIQASITAAPARRMSYYLDPVSSCQALHPPDCLGVMRTSGGMAVSLVPHTQSPAVFHPAPPRPLYGHHITLQEVPNGPEYCQSGGIYCMIVVTAVRPLVSRCAV
ncbi:hypothetical protein PO909_032778 [Leuciscus waleckii]